MSGRSRDAVIHAPCTSSKPDPWKGRLETAGAAERESWPGAPLMITLCCAAPFKAVLWLAQMTALLSGTLLAAQAWDTGLGERTAWLASRPSPWVTCLQSLEWDLGRGEEGLAPGR